VKPTSVALFVVFGSAAAYCCVGALRGHLVVPGRFGPPREYVLSGAAAWSLLCAVLSFWTAVSIREELIYVPKHRRLAWELALLFLGVCLSAAWIYVPTVTRA
jgi:hypothetical protein